MKKTAVIMAGGAGERFWPKSRKCCPKQFLCLTKGGKTMIQLTVERLLPVVEIGDIFVITNQRYIDLVRQQLPKLPAANIIAEPAARNTAPCIACAAAVISARYGDALMCVLASDHIIKNNPLFADTLTLAMQVAEQGDALVTLGITPTCPETGYGYVKFLRGPGAHMPGVYRVDRFVEKPDIETARGYLEDGTYLWNSGMFVWKASTIRKQFGLYLPGVASAADKLQTAVGTASEKEALGDFYAFCPSISVDYAIMEKAKDIYTIPCSFGWDDVGSWLSLERINSVDENGNFMKGEVIGLGTENSILFSDDHLIAAIGVQNLIIVETGDVTLVCSKDKAQDVKKIVEQLRAGGNERYL